jgi:two-component system, OmpR family, alkaline phosphatase synthesis response regulator PhoP
MTQLLIITDQGKTAELIQASLTRHDFTCATSNCKLALEAAVKNSPNLALLEIPDDDNDPIWEFIGRLKKGRVLPIIALVSPAMVAGLKKRQEIDDFIIQPYNEAELLLRINRLLTKAPGADSSEQINCDGLTIDLVTCEVTVDGKKADLTFKEYELLKLMARNRGRVFTRQALLDKIWGYDYYGGDRTVDVHMRRLRSKIEDAAHTYIETVRNIGYRFVKNPPL